MISKVHLALALLLGLRLTAASAADADWPHEGIRDEIYRAAEQALQSNAATLSKQDVLAIIDYGLPSNQPRLYVLDRHAGTVTAYLVAHGRGSDPDFDGLATIFSNEPNSRASSLGAYLTGDTYEGKHGLSLKLDGLDASNSNAAQRAIVIHGASYVDPARAVLGRSWGCPAVETRYVAEIVDKLAGGALLYIGH